MGFFMLILLTLDCYQNVITCTARGFHSNTITAHESAHKQHFYNNARISLVPDALPPHYAGSQHASLPL